MLNNMEKKIALPDTYSSYDSLKRVLNSQDIEISNNSTFLGLDVQDVRLLDVFLVAPFLLYVGMKNELTMPIRYGLIGLGLATLVYNGRNYLKNR